MIQGGVIIMKVKHQSNDIPITSPELAYLWNTYLLNSKSKHILMYFAAQCEDKDILSLFKSSVDLSAQAMDKVKEIFDSVNQRVPYAFSEEDVYMDAPKVYTDKIMLYTLKVYTGVGLTSYGTAISLSPRKDIRKFFTDSMISNIEFSNKVDDLLLEKGMYLRMPSIPTTQNAELAEDKSIMGRILGHKRPLTALEIACISNCSMVNSASEAYILGIAQTIVDPRLKEFLNRVRKTLKEQAETLNEILHKDSLAFPPSLESEVLNSSEPFLNDRLALFTSFTTLADVLMTFSTGKVGVMRKDVFMTLSQLTSEILLLVKDATDLMLERGWFEEMPKNVDKEDIMSNKQ
jgi:spore coat protein CotF